jgi:hypothetical protein
MLALSQASFLLLRQALSARTSPAVLPVSITRRNWRPSLSAAEVTAALRMNPKRRSMLICDL